MTPTTGGQWEAAVVTSHGPRSNEKKNDKVQLISHWKSMPTTKKKQKRKAKEAKNRHAIDDDDDDDEVDDLGSSIVDIDLVDIDVWLSPGSRLFFGSKEPRTPTEQPPSIKKMFSLNQKKNENQNRKKKKILKAKRQNSKVVPSFT